MRSVVYTKAARAAASGIVMALIQARIAVGMATESPMTFSCSCGGSCITVSV